MKKSMWVSAALLGASALFGAAGDDGLNRDYFENFKGGIGALKRSNSNRPGPTGSDVVKTSEATDWKGSGKNFDFSDSYGQCLYGFVVPEKSGEYVFFVAADDIGELFLSSGENPADARSLCRTSQWTPFRDFTRKPTQKSAPVKLEAGKKYYIEGVMVEGAGGDNFAIAWQAPGSDRPEIIPGKNLKTLK